MTRKICVVTSTRADYGLLKSLMHEIRADKSLKLQIIATGMHLSPEFGLTYSEIESDGFVIDRKVEILTSSDTNVGAVKSMGLGLIGFADVLTDLKPDIILILGDRFEIFSVVAAALIQNIPVAHLHGGEITEGAFDDALRHAITKMSDLHFVATEEYSRRVIQLGEDPRRVFTVGGLGVDAMKHIVYLTREELEKSIDFKLNVRNLMVVFHPVTLENQDVAEQMEELLSVLAELEDTNLIFTMPNADAGGRRLAAKIMEFVSTHPNARAYKSLGYTRFLSCLKYVDGIIGNSSSGILEAPTMGIGTINIGNRQKGRLSASSVIHCQPNKKEIRAAIKKMYEPAYRKNLPAQNPYGNGGACKIIVNVISDYELKNIKQKVFFDQLVNINSHKN